MIGAPFPNRVTSRCWLVALELNRLGGAPALGGDHLGVGAPASLRASGNETELLFDGHLYNRGEICDHLCDRGLELCSDAEVLRRAYLRWGESFLTRIRGIFSTVVLDARRSFVLCARDPLGTCSLFYSLQGDTLFVSNQMRGLLEHLGSAAPLNPAALADRFRYCWPAAGETYHRGVFRVPTGHAVRASRGGCDLVHYWDPLSGGPIKMDPREVQERFDALFRQAVCRSLAVGSPALYLSGGLDSVSVAAACVDIAAVGDGPLPHAFGLAVCDSILDETATQQGAADTLQLPLALVPLEEEIGSEGFIAAALRLTARMSSPLMSPWMAALEPLARSAAAQGHDAVLTGVGGDEWLTVKPTLAADLLRSLNMPGWWRLYRALSAGHRASGGAALRALLWQYGIQSLLRGTYQRSSGLQALGRRMRRVSGAGSTPRPPHYDGWLAPDPLVRAELEVRDRQLQEAAPAASADEPLHRQEVRRDLEHPLTSIQADELSESAGLYGLRLLKPLCDPELLEFVFRLPAQALLAGGTHKGLLREPLVRRLPGLGFEQHRKVDSGPYFRSALFSRAADLHQQLGGTPALAALGIVDPAVLQPQLEGWLAERSPRMADAIWSVLNVEAWVQAHTTAGPASLS